jgi:hypothetical protein
VSDEYAVPLCRTHHRELHRCGNERVWWENTHIDPLAAARRLWLETRGPPAVMLIDVSEPTTHPIDIIVAPKDSDQPRAKRTGHPQTRKRPSAQ